MNLSSFEIESNKSNLQSCLKKFHEDVQVDRNTEALCAAIMQVALEIKHIRALLEKS